MLDRVCMPSAGSLWGGGYEDAVVGAGVGGAALGEGEAGEKAEAGWRRPKILT